MKKKKVKRGRPPKLTKKWIAVAREVVDTDINAIILTDEELVFLINEKVTKKQKISGRTFIRWKNKNKGKDDEDKEEGDEKLDKIGVEFCHLYKKALLKQKKDLFNSLKDDDKQWQRFAWIIERKFNDWNIKKQVDITTKGESINEESREKAKKAISGFMPEDIGGGQ